MEVGSGGDQGQRRQRAGHSRRLWERLWERRRELGANTYRVLVPPTPPRGIDRRLNGLAGPEYDATISFGLPIEPEDSQYGEYRYKQLTEVRNRDAHSYHRNVRDANFPLVEEAFVTAFDILVKAMRHGEHPPAKF